MNVCIHKYDALLNLIRTKVILDNEVKIEGGVISKIELREYEKKEGNKSKGHIYTIYIKTENDEIELDYLEKQDSNEKFFDEIYDFLSKYNGLSSTINRVYIELDGRHRQ
ncbi:conserved protein of unknown function [Candidatus Nitrosocosmicus franklandus]|uniref:Uncharacterized protein n=1 Tax=Candidatus Nitrosocosmicus franklandianus TaxID=1798806 RepID=A0A484I917_9ARCH|nr:conserved protein of unknown function [Candidatus Nitrosocosmicus franklandus]